MSSIQERIDQLNAEKEKLEAELSKLREKTTQPMIVLADELHGLLCHNNHTDGCGWEYDNTPNHYFRKGSSRRYHYQMAELLCSRANLTPEEATNFLSALIYARRNTKCT